MGDQQISLGTAVRRLRDVRGLSQSVLARQMGVDPTYISHLESDRREPSLRVLRNLAGALQVPAATLFAIAVWSELPPAERSPFEGFVGTLVRGSALLGELES
jgi:transcriptional regulator with XRE-family HTH domain